MRIDLQAAVDTAEELLAGLRELNGFEPDETPTRAGRRDRAHVTRSLLYLSHLGDRASVQVMDTYHVFKIRDEPPADSPAG